MAKFAARTDVPAEKSRMEIEAILRRYGASQFISGWDETRAVIGFSLAGRQIKFILPMPSPEDEAFTTFRDRHGFKKWRTESSAQSQYEQAVRQRWRALALVIKAKLEAVESQITTVEAEFMAHIVLPDGSTVGDVMRPQIESAYETGRMPPLLPHYGED